KEFEEDPENLDANTPALEMHLETLNYDVKYNSSKWGNFEAIFGIQGMYQTNKNFGKEILIPNANVADIGFLATSHYHLEKVDFQAGLRFDSRKIDSEEHGVFGEEKYFAPTERDFTSYNGAFGVRFDILNSLIARVNVATGFRAPNLSELTSNGIHEGTNRFEIGNPNLDNEQNFQLDLSLEYRNEHFEVFANGFYNKINNYIFLNPSDEIKDENPVFEYVQNDARLYGGEAGVHLHPHPLDWLHLESSVEMVKGEQKNGENLPLIPATSFSNTLRIEFDQVWSLNNNYGFVTLKSTLAQNDISEFETNTPGYSLLSAGIGSSFKFKGQTLDLRISGNNLLDKTYISHLSRLKQDGIPNRGRNVTLSLQTSF
ncbi:MAG TPA: TonB-dependent receptor, partial [Gillisia sp.]|nr:TonB-dependent receptor [Gillisia sp.]